MSDNEQDSDAPCYIIYTDMGKSASERLVALEAMEPELLDESQTGRVLLAIEVRLFEISFLKERFSNFHKFPPTDYSTVRNILA